MTTTFENEFMPSQKTRDLLHRGMTEMFVESGVEFEATAESSAIERVEKLLAIRTLESIASLGRSMATGRIMPRPLIDEGQFEDRFVVSLDDTVRIHRHYKRSFYSALAADVLAHLAGGSKIEGIWGKIVLHGRDGVGYEPSPGKMS